MKENFIQHFVEWVRVSKARLAADQITVRLPEKVVKEGTYAEFFSAFGEATVELWDYGFSEFHVWIYTGNPQQEEVKTTHHEFEDYAEMYAALEQLVSRFSPVLV